MTLALGAPATVSAALSFPHEVLVEDRTGQPSIPSPESVITTFQPRPSIVDPAFRSALTSILGNREPGSSITSYGTTLIMEAPTQAWVMLMPPGDQDPPGLPTLLLRPGRLAPASPRTTASRRAQRRAPRAAAVLTPAEELRRLTGLQPSLLANLFQVSRTTFYKWLEGATPRDERFQHLVEVVAHVKEARQRLPPSTDFTAWLRTPISPGAKSPLEYLREARFSVFRGLVLRTASGGLSPPVTSAMPPRQTNRLDRALSRERISPTPRTEDDEDS
jgi:hypothetical protein